MRFGAHVSVTGGLCQALSRAKALGCETMQIFPGNPRSWKPIEVSDDEAYQFRLKQKDYSISPIFIHLPYLVNLGSTNDQVRQSSVNCVKANLELAKKAGINHLIIHAGSHGGAGRKAGLRSTRESLLELMGLSFGPVDLLIENTAGAGYALGAKIEDIADVFDFCNCDKRLGLCLDTCHAYAAGYNLSNKKGLDKFLKLIEEKIGLNRVKVIHANDARGRLRSGLDRHEHIGKGLIGEAGFRQILNHSLLNHLPVIIETPRGEENDFRNLAILRRLAKP
jgi:deoxyribonuclease-4